MVEGEKEFVPPPKAPVFEPTKEEFQDPLVYIAKIKPIAEKTGICKIIPPADWKPPFVVNDDTFRFTPRVQRLNELEAQSRVKLNFLDNLARFWDLQGTTLRIPNVERKHLDMFKLHKLVKELGGFEIVSKERKWSKVATRMHYDAGKGVGSVLRTHYERILYPYDLFKSGVTVDPSKLKKEIKNDKDYVPVMRKKHAKTKQELRRSKRTIKEEPNIDYSASSELRKLQFLGPGPKMAVPRGRQKDEGTKSGQHTKTRGKSAAGPRIDLYICHNCGRGDGEDQMLLCDGCDDAFHTYCLVPVLPEIPKGDWRCPKCVAKECSKPLEAYGFEQAKREYSLQSFREYANQFKADYFGMPGHMVPCSQVEKEFWRLVKSLDEDVLVEYGADIHASERGSGFPTLANKDKYPHHMDYMKSGWNLNNLPGLEQSVLGYINADISGMKVPWCYVGMCFSSFCWHTEDHWSYSINYLHRGEPKTWYGVPGSQAEALEKVMHKMAPELFVNSPDLLHMLTTMLNPNILMANGVTIVRTDQHIGEFVVTFPRAYHAGFNQGFNFAEAVNFCPADWLPIGRTCVEHYRLMKRQCVFSHEELVCKLAADPDQLDLSLAMATHEDLLGMVEYEKKLRKSLQEKGVEESEREAFELLPDDERQCKHCSTTCFLSAITCRCTPNKLVCIHHVDYLCNCPLSTHRLRYRYTLDELPTMLNRLKVRAEAFDSWAYKVKRALEAEGDEKMDLMDLKELIVTSEEKRFPDSELLQTLIGAVSEAEKCASMAKQLVGRKVRTRTRQSAGSRYVAKMSLAELQSFRDQVNNLSCVVSEAKLIQELLQKVLAFQTEARDALGAETPNSEKLQKLLETCVSLDVDIPEILQLKQLLEQARWLEEVHSSLAEPDSVTLQLVRKLIESGVSLPPHPACEKAMAELQELLTASERWEEKAHVCLQARPRHMVAALEALIDEADSIPAYLPSITALREAVRKAREWTTKVKALQNSEQYPYLDDLENLLNKGQLIPVWLDELPKLKSQVAAAESWREHAACIFLKKNSTHSLADVLSPRSSVGVHVGNKNRRRKSRDAEKDRENGNSESAQSEEQRDPAAVVASLKAAELKEIEAMRELRTRNMEKQHHGDPDAKYCICRKSRSGVMLHCELCKECFHSTCVRFPKSSSSKGKNSQTAAPQADKDSRFLCPLCLRSRRPRLENILSLLESLQKLPVRLSEAEALQFLTERAMAWQDRARQELATDEIASALAKQSVLSQRTVKAAACEKIVSSEQLKASSKTEQQRQNIAQSMFGDSVQSLSMDSGSSMQNLPTPLHSDDMQSRSDLPASMTSEHAYSAASRNTAGSTPSKHQGELPLAAHQSVSPVLALSDSARARLEELMMEGDLLEVSLDETQQIWCLLQACQQPPQIGMEQIKDIDMESIVSCESGKTDKSDGSDMIKEKKKRKRKKKEGVNGIDEKREGLMPEGVTAENVSAIPKKKKKLKDKEGKEKGKQKECSDEGEIRKKKKKQKEGEKDGEKKKKKIVSKKQASSEDDDDEEEDDCSAITCLKPSDEEVNWVQCDKCELWFHLLCVGLAEDEVSENEDYICSKCTRQVGSADSAAPSWMMKTLISPASDMNGVAMDRSAAVTEQSSTEQPNVRMSKTLEAVSDADEKIQEIVAMDTTFPVKMVEQNHESMDTSAHELKTVPELQKEVKNEPEVCSHNGEDKTNTVADCTISANGEKIEFSVSHSSVTVLNETSAVTPSPLPVITPSTSSLVTQNMHGPAVIETLS